jgi:hypothetical protein
MIRSLKLLPFFSLVAYCFMLSGCIWPVPSVDTRSLEMRGRILDARSGQAVFGARIALREHQSIHAITDESGNFRLRGTRNIHLFSVLGICSTDFPVGKYYGDTIEISHAGFETLQIKAREFVPPDFTNNPSSSLKLRDILLQQTAP